MKSFLKRYNVDIPIFFLGIALLTFIALYSKNNTLLIVSSLVFGGAFVLRVVYTELYTRKLHTRAESFSRILDVRSSYAFENLKLACCLIDSEGEIIWYNPVFEESFNVDKSTSESRIHVITGVNDLGKLKKGEGFRFRFDKHSYSVNSAEILLSDTEKDYLLYFYDQTELINLRKKFRDTRPVVMLSLLDNSDDLYEKFRESECAAIFSLIEQKIDSWASSYGAMCRKYSNARMLIIAEEKSLQKMIKAKFEILETVRTLTYNDVPLDITLSIGIGHGGELGEVRDYARQALDMSQSRGGDQVCIKDEQNYVFFGGVSEGKEQKNKVKTRFMAKSIAELIRSSSNVIIMGHRFSDFDAFGSAAGIYCLSKQLNVPAYIAVDKETTLATSMIDQYVAKFGLDTIVSGSRAMSLVENDTLLVVVDTHKRDFTEFPELVDACRRKMVIDHHRKSVGFIEDTVMFYHRPNSSSASEMVAEILQYAEQPDFLDPVTAQALFAGIMLDTRNFIIRCGVRTFEAAAYLKSQNANTVAAKKLFASDMDLFRLRNAVIDSAVKYKNVCAISVADFEDRNIRLITSQAADEMLNIQNVKSSFVLYKNGDFTNISARSYGEMNVQLIMELLGGGGHQAMSACQLKDTDFEDAIKLLKGAIDKYLEDN